MRLIFATIVSARHFSSMFTEMGVNDRLLSYAELLYAPPDFLESFVTTGVHPKKVKGRRLRDETWDSPVPRRINPQPGKEYPKKKVVSKHRKHWQSDTFKKRKALYILKKLRDLEKQEIEDCW